MNPGQRLGQLQSDGHLAIDAIYTPIATSVTQLVLRFGTIGLDGIARLVLGVVPTLKQVISRLLQSAHPEIVSTIVQTSREAERLADPIGQPNEVALGALISSAALSLRTNQAIVDSQVGTLLTRGAVFNRPIAEVAKAVAQYVSPWFSTRRNAAGEVVREARKGIIDSWPGQAGMASAHARMLMLTESQRAHARGILRRARREGQWVNYRVSANHTKGDECDSLAAKGPYRVEDAPSPPRHPNCRCYLAPTDPPQGGRTA